MDALLMILMTRLVAGRARAKGYGSLYAAPTVAFYIVGQVGSFAVGVSLGLGIGSYLVAILGALLASSLGFGVVSLLKPRLLVDELVETFR